LQPKSERYIFVGYSEDVKGYRLFQTHCKEIIIRRDVKVDENLLACEPNSVFVLSLACENNWMLVSSSACESSSAFVPSSIPVSSSYDDSADENPPPSTHLPSR
jgi:hypothetical protein